MQYNWKFESRFGVIKSPAYEDGYSTTAFVSKLFEWVSDFAFYMQSSWIQWADGNRVNEIL
jgi:hypothetical protein